MRFEGKAVIVTGGAKGIGEAVVRRFCEEGASVMISDLQTTAGEALAKELTEAGRDVFFCFTDVSDPDSVSASIEAAVDRFGKLDVLVNNAGIGEPDEKTADVPVAFWNKMIAINLSGQFYNAKFALPYLLETKGNIVNVSSIAGLIATWQRTAYNSAKSGVVGLTRSIAADYAQEGVRCNAVAPGPCETPLWSSLPNLTPEEKAVVIDRETGPIKRFSQPNEIANAILFLASEEASYVTGAVLAVDGAYTAV